MKRQQTRVHRVKSLIGGAGAALLLSLGVGCGSSTETVPTTTTVASDSEGPVLVKNKPLNDCVNVVSGQRPAPGATIPRCTPGGANTAPPRR